MTEGAAAIAELPQGQTEMPPALQRLWKRRNTMTAPLLEDINRGVPEDLLLQSAQVGEQWVVREWLMAPYSLPARQQKFPNNFQTFSILNMEA
jgi:hypothetical protein